MSFEGFGILENPCSAVLFDMLDKMLCWLRPQMFDNSLEAWVVSINLLP